MNRKSSGLCLARLRRAAEKERASCRPLSLQTYPLPALNSGGALASHVHDVTSGLQCPASYVQSPMRNADDGSVAADTPDHVGAHRCPDDDESNRRTDYAARLRTTFRDGAERALVSREDAMGAVAEIEQLWTALRAMWTRA